MRFLGFKASLRYISLGFLLLGSTPNISWWVIRPHERLIIKLGKSHLGELFQEIIGWNFGLDIGGLSNCINYLRILSSLSIP